MRLVMQLPGSVCYDVEQTDPFPMEQTFGPRFSP